MSDQENEFESNQIGRQHSHRRMSNDSSWDDNDDWSDDDWSDNPKPAGKPKTSTPPSSDNWKDEPQPIRDPKVSTPLDPQPIHEEFLDNEPSPQHPPKEPASRRTPRRPNKGEKSAVKPNLGLTIFSYLSILVLSTFAASGLFFAYRSPYLAALPALVFVIALVILNFLLGREKGKMAYYLEVKGKESLYRYLYTLVLVISIPFLFHAVDLYLNWTDKRMACLEKVNEIQTLKLDYTKRVQELVVNNQTELEDYALRYDSDDKSEFVQREIVSRLSGIPASDVNLAESRALFSGDVLSFVKDNTQVDKARRSIEGQYALGKNNPGQDVYDEFVREKKALYQQAFNPFQGVQEFPELEIWKNDLIRDVSVHFKDIIDNQPDGIDIDFHDPFYTLTVTSIIDKFILLTMILALTAVSLLNYLLMKRISQTGNIPPKHKQTYHSAIFGSVAFVIAIIILIL